MATQSRQRAGAVVQIEQTAPRRGDLSTVEACCDHARLLAHMNRGARMREYRISTIGRYGQIVAVKILGCADDERAIQKAQEMAQGLNVIELRWEGRLIKRFGA
jgi:hypothetical protein